MRFAVGALERVVSGVVEHVLLDVFRDDFSGSRGGGSGVGGRGDGEGEEEGAAQEEHGGGFFERGTRLLEGAQDGSKKEGGALVGRDLIFWGLGGVLEGCHAQPPVLVCWVGGETARGWWGTW